MSLSEIDIKPFYSSSSSNVLEDFYIPCLSNAVRYDRAVGYFSSAVFSLMARGIAPLVKNGGKIRLIIGTTLTNDEFAAIENALKENNENIFFDRLDEALLNEFCYHPDNENLNKLFQSHLDMFSWLVSRKYLEIKVAFRDIGIYHEKIGVIEDDDGEKVVFSGSNNETPAAILTEFNYEAFAVWCSWKKEHLEHFAVESQEFEKLWNNEVENVYVLPLSNENHFLKTKELLKKNSAHIDEIQSFEKFISDEKNIIEEIKKIKTRRNFILSEIRKKIVEEDIFERNKKRFQPKIPDLWVQQIRPLQREAVIAWDSSEYLDGFQDVYLEEYNRSPEAKRRHCGILQLATGAGKTRIAIMAAIKTFEALKEQSDNAKLVTIFAVPYQGLADQWSKLLDECNMFPVRCWDSRASWSEDLERARSGFKNGYLNFLSIVVVNKTLSSEGFQKFLSDISPNELFFVGDECHHHANMADKLPNAHFKMGLSATPFEDYPSLKDNDLIKYYGDVCYVYDLSQAIKDGILAKYQYHVLPVELSNEKDGDKLSEEEEFKKISSNIAAILIKNNNNFSDPDLLPLFLKRSRLLGSAKNKIKKLNEALDRWCPEPKKYSLFFCGEGVDPYFNEEENPERNDNLITTITALLNDRGWIPAQYTAKNKADRTAKLNGFKNGAYNALLSMKCLDEGVDLPACKQAFLLASANKSRQYIQRRGRVLRKQGKNDTSEALIIDFYVYIKPKEVQSESEKGLISRELKRIVEFARDAENEDALDDIQDVLELYGIDVKIS
ncbi:MAG: DEAD/DEAH box helicase family protein [Alphaproteobacteria bacterium]|nr:DEAD/DEAH box helicase family protein [Alphaproteobacteria bacterium]